jgi:2-dehydro-3-deoxyphosphogluconate aldolase/(4S)-4-hydroxy-2-oxoglutarate aldolase
MSNVLERLEKTGIVPAVVIDDISNAVLAANAMHSGGIDVMEITVRTRAGLDSIKAVVANCPYMLVGAGTVITLEQCKQCVDAGAQFIVSPGFDKAIVQWCVDNGVVVIPGCVTPSEIMQAIALGINVVKYFPANVYGGLEAIKALAGPFGNVKFIPTGAVNEQNLGGFAASAFVHAVGGSWLCSRADIAAGNFDKIRKLCADAMQSLMGFELGHIGINAINPEESLVVMEKLGRAFGFEVKPGNSSNFAGNAFEVMKSKYLGVNGHIAVKTNNIYRAIDYLKKRDFEVDMDTAKYKDDQMTAVYIKGEFGGFAVHLLQK